MMFRMLRRTLALGAGLALISLADAGVKGEQAPELRVDKWVHLPKGRKSGPKLREGWKGKVVYLYFFQSWCPGCHSSGFPTLRALEKEFAKDDAVRFAAVQTVFEGFGTNTAEAAGKLVKKYDLTRMPVGHSGTRDQKSRVMRDFKTRGTPWTVVIGKDGKVAFEGFHLKIEEGKQLIEKLK